MPIEIETVTQKLVEHLRTRIITNEIPGGGKLNEIEISESLGVSRPPLREAFRILENERLVVSVPRKGSYVAETSLSDAIELYEMRKMIECYAIDLLTKYGVQHFTAIESSLASSAAVLGLPSNNAAERLVVIKAFADFHLALIECTGNSRLIAFYLSIYSNLLRYQFICDSVFKTTQLSQEEHNRIFEFLKLSEFEKTRQLSMAHIDLHLEALKREYFTRESESVASKKPNQGGQQEDLDTGSTDPFPRNLILS
jgi:DNA-binding GntR family transcriptional regulator